MESCVQLTSIRSCDPGNTYILSFSVNTPHQWVKDVTNKSYRFVERVQNRRTGQYTVNSHERVTVIELKQPY